MMSAGRYAVAVGFGSAAWLVWFVGALWVADALFRAFGWLAAIPWLVVAVAVAIGVPTYLFERMRRG